MIKRTTALFFIMLAELLLLATAVVPHHHHHHEVCIVSCHDTSEHDLHQNVCDDHQHDHDQNSNHEYCLIEHIVVIPANKDDQKYGNFDSPTPIAFVGIHAALRNVELNSVLFNDSPHNYFPFITSSYTRYLTTSLGLRAPPLV